MRQSYVDRISLRNRIFFTILLASLISSVLVGVLLSFQYSNQAKIYHKERFKQTEKAFLEHLNFIINNTPLKLNEKTLPIVLKNKITELAAIHGLQIDIYNLKGELLISSRSRFIIDDNTANKIPATILKSLRNTVDKRWVVDFEIDNSTYQTTYHYITDNQAKNIGIVSLPYIAKDNLYEKQMREFYINFGKAFLFLVALSIFLSFLLSRTITGTLQRLTSKIIKTRLNHKNEKLNTKGVSKEVKTLIMAYNRMVDELEVSAEKLAKSERETAWREMARQVAHEIKNPLTPMRLTIQMFERTFDPQSPDWKEELTEFSETLIQQIDTMTAVASAFSNFASMPAAEKIEVDIVPVIRRAVEVFNKQKQYISFATSSTQINGFFDVTQVVRIVTNLVKNATQAVKSVEEPKIEVKVSETINQRLKIQVIDNGIGIPKENLSRIFEPKFTTKTKGMGLGLAMTRNMILSYNGTIDVTSEPGNTVFTIEIPLNE